MTGDTWDYESGDAGHEVTYIPVCNAPPNPGTHAIFNLKMNVPDGCNTNGWKWDWGWLGEDMSPHWFGWWQDSPDMGSVGVQPNVWYVQGSGKEPVGQSQMLSDVRCVVPFAPGGITGYQMGTMATPGQAVSEADEANPLKLIVGVNDDDDGAVGSGHKDNDDAAIGTNDNDIVKITVTPPSPASRMNHGTLQLTVTPSDKVRVFRSDGTAVLADYSVNLASPQGDLAALASGQEVSIYLEGLQPCADATIKLAYKDQSGTQLVKDEVHLAVVKLELGFRNDNMSSYRSIDPINPAKHVYIGALKGDTIRFKAITTPPIALPENEYVWSGEQGGTGGEIAVTFNTTGSKTECVVVAGIGRSARATVEGVPQPPNEHVWSLTYPWVAASVWLLKDEALSWAEQNQNALGGGLGNGRTDAAKHCYWNVLMAQNPAIGSYYAEGAATAHERTNLEEDNSPHNETVMDLLNNGIGRTIGACELPTGASRQQCQNAVVVALNEGRLRILDQLDNPNGSGLLQPSDE